MLALVHTLVVEGPARPRVPRQRYTVGWPVFERYLLGADGRPAEGRDLGRRHHRRFGATRSSRWPRRTSGKRTLIVVAHSLQRAEHGEQPAWMGAGAGRGAGPDRPARRRLRLCAGRHRLLRTALQRGAGPDPVAGPQRRRSTSSRSRASPTCCSRPARPTATTARRGPIPDIRLVYWAGGNPFHHHQDLNRLRRAFAAGRHASWCMSLPGPRRRATPTSCCPATMTLEREDIGASSNDPLLVPMHPVPPPCGRGARRLRDLRRPGRAVGRARGLHRGAHACANGSRISMSRRARPWSRWACRRRTSTTFWRSEGLVMPQHADDGGMLRGSARTRRRTRCRRRAAGSRSSRPRSPRYGDADCPGHPAWLESRPRCRAPSAPLLPRRQPAGDAPAQPVRFRRLQRRRQASRPRGRDACNPADATPRGIADGDIIRLFNERGACLAARAASPTASARAWCSCRPAPGTIRWIRTRTSRSASTATPTC